MLLPFSKNCRGQIGIAFNEYSVTIGQCVWKNGGFYNPTVVRIETNPQELSSDEWRTIISESNTVGSDCILALPVSIAHHQVLRLPNMAGEEIKEAATWELAERLGLERSTLQMDAIPVGTGGDVLGVAIEQDKLKSMLDPLFTAGLRPTLIEPQCLSVVRAISMLHRRQSDLASVRSVLDFGTNNSTFMVLAGDTLVFFKHLDFCGKDLIDAIACHTGVTHEQAARMLESTKEENVDLESDINKAVRDASRAIHEAIAIDAMKCLRHYGVTNRGPLSKRIIITGNAGWNQYLAHAMSNACNQEVIRDSDVKHIHALPESVLNVKGWQNALGASLAIINPRQKRLESEMIKREVA